MADNDNRNPWLDWGEPVEPTSGKSWDDWGEPVEQTGKSWDDWGVPIESPSSGAQAQPTPPRVDVEYKTPVQVNVVEEYKDETTGETKVRTVRTVEDRGQTTSVSANGGSPQQPTTPSQAPVPTPEPPTINNPSYPIGPSSTIPPTITREYIDEDGEKRFITVSNPEYERALREEQNENPESNSGGVPLQSGVGNVPVSTGGGRPLSTIPPTITREYIDEDGEKRFITVSNPEYERALREEQNENPESNSGGVPLQSGVGNVPVGAGGGSPSTGGGSGSAGNTTWGTEVIQQYSDEIPNYGSGNPDNIPKTIMQPYKNEDGEIRYREVPNPAYYSSQTNASGGNSGGSTSTPFSRSTTGTGYNKKTNYYSDYAAAHKAIKDSNYRYSAEGLRSDVEALQSYYDNVINSMDGWTGMSSNSYKNAANSIKGKLTVVMNNINESLLPACEATEDLDELLTRLEDEDENLRLLLEELNQREVDYQAALSAYNHEPSTITETTTNRITGEKETKSVPNPRKETLRIEMNSAKELLDMVQEKVDEQQKLEEELCKEIDEKIELIRTLQSKIETMNSYVNPLGYNYYRISSNEKLNNNYDTIVNDLDFSSPSIPNQSDYHDGDNVVFDDSYGEVVTITQGHGSGGTGGGVHLQMITQ